jgi:hypothetical protein
VSKTVRLHPETVCELAVAIADELRNGVTDFPGGRPLTVGQVGEMFGRSREWVRDHRDELGVLPTTGTRPRLMFDPAKVQEAMRAPTPIDTTRPKPHGRRRRRSSPDLLPIRGRS